MSNRAAGTPDEIWAEIFLFLSIEDVVRVRLVSKRMSVIACDNGFLANWFRKNLGIDCKGVFHLLQNFAVTVVAFARLFQGDAVSRKFALLHSFHSMIGEGTLLLEFSGDVDHPQVSIAGRTFIEDEGYYGYTTDWKMRDEPCKLVAVEAQWKVTQEPVALSFIRSYAHMTPQKITAATSAAAATAAAAPDRKQRLMLLVPLMLLVHPNSGSVQQVPIDLLMRPYPCTPAAFAPFTDDEITNSNLLVAAGAAAAPSAAEATQTAQQWLSTGAVWEAWEGPKGTPYFHSHGLLVDYNVACSRPSAPVLTAFFERFQQSAATASKKTQQHKCEIM